MTEMRARMVQKHDTTKNWDAITDFIPKEGEILVYDNNKIKIGNDKDLPKDLPFLISEKVANGSTVGTSYQPVFIDKGTPTAGLDLSTSIAAEDPQLSLPPIENGYRSIDLTSTKMIGVGNDLTANKILLINDEGFIQSISKEDLINEIINRISSQK